MEGIYSSRRCIRVGLRCFNHNPSIPQNCTGYDGREIALGHCASRVVWWASKVCTLPSLPYHPVIVCIAASARKPTDPRAPRTQHAWDPRLPRRYQRLRTSRAIWAACASKPRSKKMLQLVVRLRRRWPGLVTIEARKTRRLMRRRLSWRIMYGWAMKVVGGGLGVEYVGVGDSLP